MGKIVGLFLVFVIIVSCGKTKKEGVCSITAEITNAGNQKIYVMEKKGYDYIKTDSTTIKDGKFYIELENSYPRDVLIVFESSRSSVIQLYVEEGDINVNGDYNNLRQVVRTGTKTLTLQREFDAVIEPMLNEMKELREQFGNVNREEMSADEIRRVEHDIQLRYVSLDSMIKVKEDSVIKNNNDNIFAAVLLMSNKPILNLAEVESLLSRLSPSMPKNIFLDKMMSLKDRLASVELGAAAPEIILNDVMGKELKLSSLKGKVVLIDFWATWSKEWNEDKQNLSLLYEKYKENGFTIYGVSLDNSKEEWLKYTTESKMPWCNVFEEKGTFMDSYVVSNIPHRLLIDADGKIIAKNVPLLDFEAEITKILDI